MVVVRSFNQEEVSDVVRIALDAVSRQRERTAKGLSASGQAGVTAETEKAKVGAIRKGIRGVAQAAKINLVNRFLGLLPEEVSAGFAAAGFLGDLADVVPILGRPVGAAAGAVVGPAIVQAQRKLRRVEQRIQAIQAAGGLLASKEFVTEQRLDLEGGLKEFGNVKKQIVEALTAGDMEKLLQIFIKISTEGRATVAAVKAYTDELADQQGVTRAKTAAQQAFNRAQGPYVPKRLFDAYNIMHRETLEQFNSFYKDPPLKG